MSQGQPVEVRNWTDPELNDKLEDEAIPHEKTVDAGLKVILETPSCRRWLAQQLFELGATGVAPNWENPHAPYAFMYQNGMRHVVDKIKAGARLISPGGLLALERDIAEIALAGVQEQGAGQRRKRGKRGGRRRHPQLEPYDEEDTREERPDDD